MKWFVFCISILAVASTAAAAKLPIEQGSRMIAGQVAFSYAGGDLYEVGGKGLFVVSFAPSYSQFISDGVALGLVVDLVHQSRGGYHYTRFGVGPVLSLYLGLDKSRSEPKGAVYPLVRLKVLRTSYSGGGSQAMWTLGALAGTDVMISNSVAVQPAIEFQHDIMTRSGYDNVSGYYLQAGVSVEAFVF